MNLEEVKSDVLQSLEYFNKHCYRTAILLSKLKSKHTTFLEHLNTITPEDYKNNINFINNERNIEHFIQKKVMDMNLELEKLCREIMVQSQCFDTSSNQAELKNHNKTHTKVEQNVKPEQKLQIVKETSFTDQQEMAKTKKNILPLLDNESSTVETVKEEDKNQKNHILKDSVDIIHRVLCHNENNRKQKAIMNITPDLSYKASNDDCAKVTGYIKDNLTKPMQVKYMENTTFPVLIKPKVPDLNSICSITYVKSPSEFYVAAGNDPYQKLNLLNENLEKTYCNSRVQFTSKKEVQNYIKSACVAFSIVYNAWYRAIIENFKPESKDEIVVKFIDYGNMETISLNYLRTIKEEFCKLPIVSQRCHLAYLYPKNWKGCDKELCWSEDILHKFEYMISEKVFILCFVLQENNSLAVDLLHSENTDGKTIGDIMLLKEMVIEIIDNESPPVEIKDPNMVEQIMKAQGQNGIKNTMSDSEVLDVFFENDKVNEPGNINEAVANYSAKDEERICKFMLSNGNCPRKNCSYEHTTYSKNVITTDKEAIYHDAMNELVLPVEGDEVDLKITYVKNACQFYAIQDANSDESKENGLYYLLKMMNTKETVKTYKPVTIIPSIGEMVLVFYDDKWLRGKVIDYITTETDMFKIFLVDYGDEIEAKLSNLKGILKEFLNLPFQAIACYLSNVYLKKDSNTADGTTFFESRYLCETLKAKVVSSNLTSLQVILYDQCNKDISNRMIEEGFLVKDEWSFKSKTSLILID